jgi:hypothetical protein
MRKGCDISTHQDSDLIAGHVDFVKMRSWGMDFVIIRAGQGNWRDYDFDRNWTAAKGILPRSSYFYYDNRFPPKEQAQVYHDAIKLDPEGVCWLDLEDKKSGVYSGWQDWYDFIAEFQRRCNYPLGIYSGYYFWTSALSQASTYQKQYFKQFPLWLAQYPPDPFNVDHSKILVPYPWDNYLILQSGTPAIGHAAGVESEELDYDIFMGTDEQFKAYFWAPNLGEQEEGNTMTEEYKIVWEKGANERKGPSTWDATTGRVYIKGEFIKIAEVIVKVPDYEVWGKLENGYYIALVYAGSVRAEKVVIPQPNEPLHTILVYPDGSLTIDGKPYV